MIASLLSFVYHDIFLFLVLLSVLVFFHELGHFLVARLFGVKVRVFSVGFGKELIGVTDKKGTRWRLSYIPLGGYVSMQGEQTNLESTQDVNDFSAKSPLKRILIVLAGPFANILIAFLLFLLLPIYSGINRLLPNISSVLDDSPAYVAGIKSGDIILKVDNTNIKYFDDIAKALQNKGGQKISIELERSGKEISTVATLENVGGNGRLGIMADSTGVQNYKLGLGESFINTSKIFQSFSFAFVDFFKRLFIGNVASNEVGSVFKIAKMSADASEVGFSSWLWFLAIISLNLAVINLLPIPGLDGGHFVLYVLELLMPKVNHKKIQFYALRVGFIFLMFLMFFALFNDFYNMFLDR